MFCSYQNANGHDFHPKLTKVAGRLWTLRANSKYRTLNTHNMNTDTGNLKGYKQNRKLSRERLNTDRRIRPLSVPTRRSDIGFLVRLAMGNDALLDFKGIDDLLPRLKVNLEDSLLLGYVLLLNLILGTWFCGVFGYRSVVAWGAL